MPPRHLVPVLLVAGAIGLALPAQAQNPLSLLDAPKLAPPSSIGLPPSIQEENDGKAAGGGKAKKSSARSGASENAASGKRSGAQALRGPGTTKASAERPLPRRESEGVSDTPGVPRLQPSLDPSSGRLGLGGRF